MKNQIQNQTVPVDELEAFLNQHFSHSPPSTIIPLPDGQCRVIRQLHSGYSEEQGAVIDHVVQSDRGDVLVVAGPGSGKTRTLTGCLRAQVESGRASGEECVAISFTNNASAELLVRLSRMAEEPGMESLKSTQVSTFHAWVGGLSALHLSPWHEPPLLMPDAALALALHLQNPDGADQTFQRFEIGAADRHLEGCETFEDMRKRNFNGVREDDASRIAFENLRAATEAMSEALAENQLDTYGTLMRRGIELAKDLQPGSIRWVFIDEAQDMNSVQRDFILAVKQATGCRIFAIADDDQGIYKFRGAGNSFLIEMMQQPDSRTFYLGTNYRSTRPIVETCLSWIRPNWEAKSGLGKKLRTGRQGLPVVLLTAGQHKARGEHARIILDACREKGLLDSMGEVAALSFSPNQLPFELTHGFTEEEEINRCGDLILSENDRETFLNKLEGLDETEPGWHHDFWEDYVSERLPECGTGLASLYATLETAKRLAPEVSPSKLSNLIRQAVVERKIPFSDERPHPDYAGDRINFLSLHASKGMEFRVVWLIDGGFAFGNKSNDASEGQPNILFQQQLMFIVEGVKQVIGKLARAEPSVEELKEISAEAIRQENRRLLYVGMSRATDLLMISMPPGGKENEFRTAFEEAVVNKPGNQSGKIMRVETDSQARTFARKIKAEHRHPDWEPPKRYRIESFTSLTGQRVPGEERTIEQPPGKQIPRPQTRAAMLGDQFHRIMHLLCLEPETLAKRMKGELSNQELIARVSARPTGELTELEAMLENYFNDTETRPWEWMKGAKSEVPFRHVMEPNGEEIIVKGFIDLVQFDEKGKPTLIVDYKTGGKPKSDEITKKYADQLELYAEAMADRFQVEPRRIEVMNYYIR